MVANMKSFGVKVHHRKGAYHRSQGLDRRYRVSIFADQVAIVL